MITRWIKLLFFLLVLGYSNLGKKISNIDSHVWLHIYSIFFKKFKIRIKESTSLGSSLTILLFKKLWIWNHCSLMILRRFLSLSMLRGQEGKISLLPLFKKLFVLINIRNLPTFVKNRTRYNFSTWQEINITSNRLY